VVARALTWSRHGSERAWRALPLLLALGVWRCPVAELLGVPCPGCGLTRAALALVAGDVAGALRLHPLSLALIPFGAWLGWRELARGAARGAPAGRRRSGGSERLVTALAAGFVALALVVWISRFFGAFGGPVPVASHLHG